MAKKQHITGQTTGKPGRRGRRTLLRRPTGSRTPAGSNLYHRVLPALIVVMALLMAALILFAVGVLVGIVPFR